jgi:hypothetical protein
LTKCHSISPGSFTSFGKPFSSSLCIEEWVLRFKHAHCYILLQVIHKCIEEGAKGGERLEQVIDPNCNRLLGHWCSTFKFNK